MTDPPRSDMAARQAHWVQISTPSWFTCTVLLARDTSMPIIGPMYGFVAALLTRMSRPPRRSTVAATHASAASGSPALAANQATSPVMEPAASLSWSSLRDEIITRAPASAMAAAMARPIPLEAPVTSATLPSSLSSMSPNHRLTG